MTVPALVNIHTKDRYMGSPSSFRIRLPTPIRNPSRVSLMSIEMPLQVHNVRAPYNTFSWAQGGTTYSAAVTPGVYTIDTLLAALTTSCNGASATVFSFSYSSTYLSVSLTTSTSITINSTPLSSIILGFGAGQTGTSITATSAYNMVMDTYLLIHFPNLPSNLIGATGHFKVPLTADMTYLQYYSENSAMNQAFSVEGEGQLGELWVSVYDVYGNTVPMNGVDWSMMLRVE